MYQLASRSMRAALVFLAMVSIAPTVSAQTEGTIYFDGGWEWCDSASALNKRTYKLGPDSLYLIREYDRTGRLRMETHGTSNLRPFNRQGLCVYYHANGLKGYKATFVNDSCDGIETYWNTSGVMISQVLWQHGVRNGPARYWFDNGSKEEEGNFLNGVMHGKWTVWHSSGYVEERATYVNGCGVGRLSFWYRTREKMGIVDLDTVTRNGRAIWYNRKGAVIGRETIQQGNTIAGWYRNPDGTVHENTERAWRVAVYGESSLDDRLALHLR